MTGIADKLAELSKRFFEWEPSKKSGSYTYGKWEVDTFFEQAMYCINTDAEVAEAAGIFSNFLSGKEGWALDSLKAAMLRVVEDPNRDYEPAIKLLTKFFGKQAAAEAVGNARVRSGAGVSVDAFAARQQNIALALVLPGMSSALPAPAGGVVGVSAAHTAAPVLSG